MTLAEIFSIALVLFLAIGVSLMIAVTIIGAAQLVVRIAAEIVYAIVCAFIYFLGVYLDLFIKGAKSVPSPHLVLLGWTMWWNQVDMEERDERLIFWRSEPGVKVFIDSRQCVITKKMDTLRLLKVKGVNYVLQDILLDITFNPQTATDHVPFSQTGKNYLCFYFVFTPTLALIGAGIVTLLILRFK
jgi:hypothetical protein